MTDLGEQYVDFQCPRCGAGLRARVSKGGRKLPCPKCTLLVEVPRSDPPDIEWDGQEEYALRGLNDVAGTIPAEQHSGAVIPVSLPPEEPPAQPRANEPGEKRAEPAAGYSERPKLPRHPMITGVFTFLFQLGTVVFAVTLSVLAAAVLGFGVMALGFGTVATVPTWTFSMLMSVAAIVLGVIWLIVASECLLCILQDSAAGNTRIENWPDAVWLDWIGDSFYLITSGVGSAGIGLGAVWLCGRIEVQTRIPLPLGVFVFFPILLLSTLETQSPLVPISPIVLRSLFRSCSTWAVFYFEAAFVVLVPAGLLWLTNALRYSADLGGAGAQVFVLVISATAAAVVISAMIYFRLLGRLAWVCAEDLRAAQKEDEDFDGDGSDEDEDEDEDDAPDIRPTPVNDF
jgi:hypothetical protein